MNVPPRRIVQAKHEGTTPEGIKIYELPGDGKILQIVMLEDYQKTVKELKEELNKLNEDHSTLWGKYKALEIKEQD